MSELRPSRRFKPSGLARWMVPIALAMLLLALLATFVVTGLAVVQGI